MKKFKNIAVYGGGSWGTALACQVARCYEEVPILVRENNIIDEMLNNRTNSKYLGSDITLPNNIIPCSNLPYILNKEVIIIAVPSFAFQETLEILKDAGISESVALLVATKGFGRDPTELLSDKVKAILPANPLAFIAGPNLAKEVAQDLLTSVTIASLDVDLARRLAISLASPQFKVTITDYVVVMQVASAVKNIIAIKSGWYDAKGYGQNAKAGLITQGLQEIKILSEAIDGELEDASILCAPGILGDLVLTCYSKESRNTRFGYELGKNLDVENFLNQNLYLAEGRESAKLVLDLIRKYKLVLPVIESVIAELKIV
ncbi:MAG: NAD(P)H-dependent glycerol-3-phosphate dehydrogenase [Rickettsia endosymbiont of Pseudomimeciton antennatum]|nr:NAD(P)H-dependent glycerol-3-phosphate dehydrogenase [Rickettsia endosymbiont of Pseudomimeciton antennatum]MCC8398784.1 NAD(P)H-dependent glycerol-3-phosphate dehydrogenase [Rickettsia endosymbiont of Labidopullus appendiculatus]